MKEILRTRRLLLREMTEGDIPDLEEMLLDPEVMYAYPHTFTKEDVENRLARQQQRYRQDGFGLWAVVLRSTGEMVGQAGLTWQDCEGQPVLEVGYLLKKRFWHQGYASEAARACRLSGAGGGEGQLHHQDGQPGLYPGGPAQRHGPGEGVYRPLLQRACAPLSLHGLEG